MRLSFLESSPRITLRRIVSLYFEPLRMVPPFGLALIFAVTLAMTCTREAKGATQAANFKHEVGLGGQVITTTDTAQFLVVPDGAEHAHFVVKTADACFGHDISGAAPTPTSSEMWLANSMFDRANDPLMLKRLRVISCAPGVAATVHVYYSRSRRVRDAQ